MTDRLDRWADPPLLVLASLADQPKHGYAITQDVADTMGVRLSAGTLYAVLSRLESRGLIEPKRSSKGTRLYSQDDVDKLRRIQEMTADLGLNLAGVERVLRLEEEIDSMHARIEEIELQALQAQVRLAEELEQVRRSFRAELTVPYRGGRELVRAVDARSPFRIKPKRRPDDAA